MTEQYSYTAPCDVTAAIALQKDLASRVRLQPLPAAPRIIAGIDAAYGDGPDMCRAAIVTMTIDRLLPEETVTATVAATFPYIPGLLSFRELPAILAALRQLKTAPDLLMVDGQGIAHPRRLGIAAHLGVLTGLPAMGVAKSRLTGRFEDPGLRKGDRADLLDKGEVIGAVLRSKDNVSPLFISPGHLMDHETAVAITLRCLTRYRLPEPTRLADKISKEKTKGTLI